MANDGREENGAGTSMDAVGSSGSGSGSGNSSSNGNGSGMRGGEAGAELRSWDQVLDNATPSTSPPYWDTDDDDPGPRPSDLYGKFTWKIEKFSEISKRELRSNMFEVGGYKWYILVYPQGCDVCNHLSLFLCVSDYDKLLPGWSHFAQFTIAVVNKDPKKSKYSDTLHRFCKKEHDWGWKKFMELSKVSDGFIMADILVIKAQVQVIRENSHRPFRCLDCMYRRELVRVYLTNVEGICRRFVEEKREKLGKLIDDNGRWSSFRAFWSAIEENVRQRLSREKTDVVLKAIVKRFFNEKEVTSTLVMDALYSGCKALNYRSRNKKEKRNSVEVDSTSFQVVWVEKDTFVLADDVLTLLEKAATEPLPPFKEDKGPQNRTKDCSGDDFAKDNVERDEIRLTELGKRTIEIFVLAHLFSNHVEVAYREAVALKMQEELILEEEAAGQAEIEFRAKREAAEKEKRSKKKQAKQKRNNRKDKNRGREEKGSSLLQDKDQQENSLSRKLNESCLEECATPNLANLRTAEEDDDLSGLDTTDNFVGTLGPAIEDGDLDRTDWDRDDSETHQVMEASFSGDVSMQPAQSCRVGRKHQVAVDDSSSTCSTDSLASVVANASYKGRPLLADRSQSLNRGKVKTNGERYEKDGSLVEIDNFRRGASTDSNGTPEASSSAAGLNAKTVILSLKERVQWLEQRLVEKEEEVVLLQEKLSLQHHHVDDDRPNKQSQDRTADCCFKKDSDLSSSIHVDEGKHDSSCFPADGASMDSNKPCSQVESRANHVPPNNVPNQRINLPKSSSSKSNAQLPHASSKHDQLKSPTHQTNNTESSLPSQNNTACTDENLSSVSGQSFAHFSGGSNEVAGISRPSSAPLIPAGPRPTVPVVSIQTIPLLSRSVSASGRLGVGDSMASNSTSLSQNSHVTPSYKMAAVGKVRSTYAGHVPLSVSSANTPVAASPSQGSTASHSSVFLQNTMSSSALPPCTIPGSPHSSHRMGMHNEYSSGRTSCDASPSSSGAIGSYVCTSQLSFLIGPEKEQGICGAANQSERPVGFTFGSVTPEMLNRQRSHGHMQNVEDSISRVQEKSFRVDRLEHQQSLLDQHIHQQPQGGQNLKVYQVHSELDGHDIRVQQAAMNDLGMQGPPMHVYPSTDVRQVSSIMSEEFPHLDIINDLLDDEQHRGKALGAMLQHPGGQHLNRRITFPGLERLNSGHLLPELNHLKGDRVEISRLREDGLFQLHSSSDPSSVGLRESLQMVPPYAHSLYGQSYSQQGSIFEGIPSHHWPISNTDFPGASISNNGYGGLNTPMTYPMHGNHISLGDCSNFTTGQNDYTIFSPRKDL